MQRVLLQIPVPAYLKKILDIKFGDNYNVTCKNLFGMAVINSLKKKREKDYEISRKKLSGNYRFKESSEYFSVNISIDTANRKGFAHNLDTALRIAKAVDREIREELYCNCIFNKEKYGIEYQTTILNFLELYDITEEELSYESLRKDFNRNKKKIADKLKINV